MQQTIPQTLVPVAESSSHSFTAEQIDIIKNSVAKGVSDQELAYFLEVCRSTGLNPLHRQIYAILRSGKMTIQTGIDGYRLLAHRSGRHAGTDDVIYDTETAQHPNKATVTVYKMVRGVRCPFTATARWTEYKQDAGQMWSKMPYLMPGKVAEALALRKTFPAETSGIYTDAEMDQAEDTPVTVVEEARARVTGTEGAPVVIAMDYKKSAQDRWNELHDRALAKGFSEAVWRAALAKYPTTAAMGKALDAYQAQQEVTPAPPAEEPEQPAEDDEFMRERWAKLRIAANERGWSADEYEQLVADKGGDYGEVETKVMGFPTYDKPKVPAGKGRHS